MIVFITSEKGEMGGSLKENWKEIREEIVRSMFKNIKILGMDDSLQSAQVEEFDVPYADSQGDKVETFFMVTAGSSRSVIIPMDEGPAFLNWFQ